MRHLILYIAVSLDGYIADETGGVSWLGGDGSQPEREGSYPAFLQSVDTVLLGYTTYHQIRTELSPHEWPYEGKRCYVLTHRPPEEGAPAEFVCEPLPALLARLRAQEGGDVWLCGGASLVRQAMADDLIDRYVLNVMPTLLGAGIPLFDSRKTALPLRLLGTAQYNGVVDLTYERKR